MHRLTTMLSLPPEVILNILQVSSTYSTERWIEHLIVDGPLPPDPAVQRHASQKEAWWQDYPKPYDWICLTHVCRSWRQLALSTSSLWTHVAIVGATDEPVVEVLKRASNQLLTVTCPTHRPRDRDRLQYILSHNIGRISTAVLPAVETIITPALARQATHLTTLVLVEPGLASEEIEHPDVPYDFPALRHIRITCVILDFFTHFFSRTLTSLVLQHPDGNPYQEPPPWAHPSHVLATALLHTPLLEELVVSVYEYTEPVAAEPALPNLRELGIKGAAAPCLALYRALQVPRNVRIHLHCKAAYIPMDLPSFSDAPRALAAALADPSLVDGTRFEPAAAFAVGGNETEYELRGWRTASLVDGALDVAQADVRLVIPTRCSQEDVRALLTALPLPRPRIMELGPFPFILGNGAAALGLAALPSLEKVILRTVPPEFVCAVATATSASQIYLHDTPFAETCLRTADEDVQAMKEYFMNDGTLEDLVAACANREHRLEQVYLADTAQFGAADAASLRDVVGEMIWDGEG